MQLIILLVTLLLSQLAWTKELIINSTPDKAEVRIVPLSGGEGRKAGETPFKIPVTEASGSYANGADLFIIEVQKEGYEPYRLVVPEFIKSDLNIDIILNQRSDWDTLKKIDKGVTDLFEVQRMIRSRNYDGAIKKIDEVEKYLPKLSVTKELQAAAYYMQNDYKRALDYYQQAYAANTENLDAYKMIVYLEKAMGIKKVKDDQK
jgi:tetratricopeptide (TPR) repeat protein